MLGETLITLQPQMWRQRMCHSAKFSCDSLNRCRKMAIFKCLK